MCILTQPAEYAQLASTSMCTRLNHGRSHSTAHQVKPPCIRGGDKKEVARKANHSSHPGHFHALGNASARLPASLQLSGTNGTSGFPLAGVKQGREKVGKKFQRKSQSAFWSETFVTSWKGGTALLDWHSAAGRLKLQKLAQNLFRLQACLFLTFSFKG